MNGYVRLLVVAVFFGALLMLGGLGLIGVFDNDCSARELDAADNAAQVVWDDLIPQIEEARSEAERMRIRAAAAIKALRACRLANYDGPFGHPGIQMNEELGAYSDPEGRFYCFPVEGG